MNWASRDLDSEATARDFIEAHIRRHTPTARDPLPLIEQDAVAYQRFIAAQQDCDHIIDDFDRDEYDTDEAFEEAYHEACESPCEWDEERSPKCHGKTILTGISASAPVG